MSNIPTIEANKPIPLPATGTWPDAVHLFDPLSAHAIRAALAAQRPLLVRGEPGTGKSQLARAAAEVLKWNFVSEVVHSSSEASDLLWHFDAVARLGEAQAMAGADPREREKQLNPCRFLSPGPLWWVFDRGSAKVQFNACLHPRQCVVNSAKDGSSSKGTVLLIDEIDKADSDFPNSLLEVLGNGAFPIPYVGGSVTQHGKPNSTLVIITTNEERELPTAFLRRCMVLHLEFAPNGIDPIEWLMTRGQHHFGDISDAVRRKAAELLMRDREDSRQNLGRPGQAEYLDMLRAVCVLEKSEEKQIVLLDEISQFSLKKFAGMEGL